MQEGHITPTKRQVQQLLKSKTIHYVIPIKNQPKPCNVGFPMVADKELSDKLHAEQGWEYEYKGYLYHCAESQLREVLVDLSPLGRVGNGVYVKEPWAFLEDFTEASEYHPARGHRSVVFLPDGYKPGWQSDGNYIETPYKASQMTPHGARLHFIVSSVEAKRLDELKVCQLGMELNRHIKKPGFIESNPWVFTYTLQREER